MEVTKKNNQLLSIDVTKFLMSIFVVAIHTTKLNEIKLVGKLLNLAVPFFFIASGYLIGKKINNNENADELIKKNIKKYIRLYTFSMLVYSPLAIYYFVINHFGFLESILRFLRGFFFIGEQYNSWPLWYLLSSIYAFIIILFIHKKSKFHIYLIILSGFATIISIAINLIVKNTGNNNVLIYIYKLIKVTIHDGRIFGGLIYIPIGILLSSYELEFIISFTLFFCSFITSLIIDNYIINVLLLISTSIGIFNILVKINVQSTGFSLILRKTSIVIYLVHMYVWTFYYCIRFKEKTYSMENFIATTIISLTISLIYIFVKNKLYKRFLCNEKNTHNC